MNSLSTTVISGVVAAALAGCAGTRPDAGVAYLPSQQGVAMPALSHINLDAKLENASSTFGKLAAAGIQALKAGNLAEASKRFNIALKLNISNSQLHYLNALTYHLMALRGDANKYELAEEGYRIALRFSPSNWEAEHSLGLCYLDQRKYGQAQEQLAEVAKAQVNNPDVLYDLAVAAYYAGDVQFAKKTIDQLREIAPKRLNQGNYMRAETLILAAANDIAGAKAKLQGLGQSTPPTEAAEFADIEQRVGEWEAFYRVANAPAASDVVVGSVVPSVSDGVSGVAGQPVVVAGGSSFVEDKMVIVDVVLISTLENANSSYGVNLLKGLQLQFGDPATNTAAYTRANTQTADSAGTNTASRTITSNMRIPSLTYSLNIAEALNDRNDVIAKPSLVALAGQTSEFFSGSQIQAAAVSGGAGSSISISQEVGVKLSVKPDFLPDGRVRLQIAAQRTFLTAPSSSVVFQYRLDTSKTNVSANVVLNYGETLVLSGLTEQEITSSNAGVPLLRDIPGINLFFSQHTNSEYHKSVLMLITPRRPIYNAQADRLNGKMSELEGKQPLSELRESGWYRAADNAREKQARDNAFMRQFQLGDIQLERWEKRASFSKGIQRALRLLDL